MNNNMPSVPPATTPAATRLLLHVCQASMDALHALQSLQGIRIGEILRRALAIYKYLVILKAANPDMKIYIEKSKNEQLVEFIIPGIECK